MKRVGLFFLLLVLSMPVTMSGHEHVKPVKGEIVKIDQQGNILVVRAGKEDIALQLLPDTAVRSGKIIKLAYEKDAFSDFKVGDRVGVTYITDAKGNKLAHSILRLSRDGKGGKAKPAAGAVKDGKAR